MSVLQAYRSLNEDQKRALREKKLDLTLPVNDMLATFKPLASCDAMADKVRGKFGCTFGLGIVLTIVAFFFCANLGWSLGTIAIVLAVLAIAVWAGFFWFWTKSIDVSNNFRQFVIPVLTVLKEDIDPAQPVQVQIDLTGPTTAPKKVNESAPYKAGNYYKIVDTFYKDPWMSAQAVLVDGTKLTWSIVDAIRERKKTKRNPRGKIKTKTKYTKKSDLEVSIGLRNKNYEVTAPAGGEVDRNEKRTRVKLERQVVTQSLEPIDPRALLDVVAEVYRSTRPATKEGQA
jgi:hypothetical protein